MMAPMMMRQTPRRKYSGDESDLSSLEGGGGRNLFARLKHRAEEKKQILSAHDVYDLTDLTPTEASKSSKLFSKKRHSRRREHMARLGKCFSDSVSSLEVDLNSDDEDDDSISSYGQHQVYHTSLSRFSASPKPAHKRCFDSIPELPSTSERSIQPFPSPGRRRDSLSNSNRSSRSNRSSPIQPQRNEGPLGDDEGVDVETCCKEQRWSGSSESLRADAMAAALQNVALVHRRTNSDFKPHQSPGMPISHQSPGMMIPPPSSTSTTSPGVKAIDSEYRSGSLPNFYSACGEVVGDRRWSASGAIDVLPRDKALTPSRSSSSSSRGRDWTN